MSGSVTGSSPNWVDGYVPPATEWNNLWSSKADKASTAFNGAPFLSLGGGTMVGILNLRAAVPTGQTEAISKGYADSHYAPLSGGSGTSSDFLVGGNLSVTGTSTLTGNTSVGGTLQSSGDFTTTGNAHVGKQLTVSGTALSTFAGPVTMGGELTAQGEILATAGTGIGTPCVGVYSGRAGQAGGAGMWLDVTDATTVQALYWGTVDAGGSPISKWGAIALNRIGLNSTADVAFVMTGGALWFGNFSNAWQMNAPTALKPGGGTWTAASDARIKRDVQDYDRGLDAIMDLRPVRYRYRDNWFRGEHRCGQVSHEADIEYFGLVAQEVEAVMPEMVGCVPGGLDDDDTVDELLTVNTTALIFALVNACKELAARVTALERL